MLEVGSGKTLMLVSSLLMMGLNRGDLKIGVGA